MKQPAVLLEFEGTHQVGDDLRDTSWARKWESAFFHDLVLSTFGNMVHQNDNLEGVLVENGVSGNNR